jgi:2-keto-4-pentenoate hydratase
MVLTTSGGAQVGGALTQAERTLAADALYLAEDAGHVILPGSCTRACDVAAHQTVRADFDVLGSVTTRFD